MQYWNQVQPYLVPFALFIVLAPGLILSLPATSKANCNLIAPLPDDIAAGGYCENGTYHPDGGGDYDPTELVSICQAQQKCNSVVNSRTVTVGTVFLHAFVFLLLLYVVENYNYLYEKISM